ncbi:MAG: hypothetical protein KatS3mg111_3566 [Pirellulaceae bacterium]|nr:MAG: hypothetical protein KatS3mg111_3566 [Pirellulaceae bacterium]
MNNRMPQSATAQPRRSASSFRRISIMYAIAVPIALWGHLVQGQTTQGLILDNAHAPVSVMTASAERSPRVGSAQVGADLLGAAQGTRTASAVQPAGYFAPHRADLLGPAVSNPCVPGCNIRGYGSYEALWLRREGDERFSLSRNAFLSDFEYEMGGDIGGRYTFGWMMNCVDGWEVSYIGPYDWRRNSSVTASGTLQSRFFPTGGYTGNEVSAFNNADAHAQSWRAQLNSIELNRKWWEWDVVSTMIGIRYVDYEEDFGFASSNSVVGNGLFLQSVDNEMVGVQLGVEAMYPVTLRTNMGVRAKGGVYANFAESQTYLNNAGTIILNAGDTDVDIAGLIEVGYFASYSVTPSVRITAGYELWYLPRIATIPEQRPQVISPSSGTSVLVKDEIVVHGGSVGVQVLF